MIKVTNISNSSIRVQDRVIKAGEAEEFTDLSSKDLNRVKALEAVDKVRVFSYNNMPVIEPVSDEKTSKKKRNK